MRPAGRKDIIDYLAAQGVFQDAREIAAVSALLGAGQLMAGADPAEVGIAAAAGAGVSAAVKPLAAVAGRGVGRYLDRHPVKTPAFANRMHAGFMGAIPGSRVDIFNRIDRGELDHPSSRLPRAIYNVNYKDGDRTRGNLEGDYGMIARRYGDNVAQALVQLMAPGLMPEPATAGPAA